MSNDAKAIIWLLQMQEQLRYHKNSFSSQRRNTVKPLFKTKFKNNVVRFGFKSYLKLNQGLAEKLRG